MTQIQDPHCNPSSYNASLRQSVANIIRKAKRKELLTYAKVQCIDGKDQLVEFAFYAVPAGAFMLGSLSKILVYTCSTWKEAHLFIDRWNGLIHDAPGPGKGGSTAATRSVRTIS